MENMLIKFIKLQYKTIENIKNTTIGEIYAKSNH